MRKYIVRHSLKFGALIAFCCLAFFMVLLQTQANPLAIRRVDIGFNIILIWAAIWYFKRYNGGILHFYQGFSIGFLSNLFGAILTGFLLYFFIEYINNEPFKAWMEASKNLIKNNKGEFERILNTENVKRTSTSFENSSPSILIFDEIMFKLFCIVPITLLTMILRTIKK